MNAIDRHIYRYLTMLVVIVLAGGTFFYHFVEKFTWINAWYFCVVTLSTVGYGDIVPTTPIGKLFTSFYIIIGVGIITAFFSATVRRRGTILRDRISRIIPENESTSPAPSKKAK